MAETELETNHSDSQRLYSAWRVSRANWELASHHPCNLGDDLPEEIEVAYCDAQQAALLAYLIHPASDLSELARKLSIFRDEGASQFTRSDEIIDALLADARIFASQEIRIRDKPRLGIVQPRS